MINVIYMEQINWILACFITLGVYTGKIEF